MFGSVDREGSGRIHLPALRCRELNIFWSALRYSHPTLQTHKFYVSIVEDFVEDFSGIDVNNNYVAVKKEKTVFDMTLHMC